MKRTIWFRDGRTQCRGSPGPVRTSLPRTKQLSRLPKLIAYIGVTAGRGLEDQIGSCLRRTVDSRSSGSGRAAAAEAGHRVRGDTLKPAPSSWRQARDGYRWGRRVFPMVVSRLPRTHSRVNSADAATR